MSIEPVAEPGWWLAPSGWLLTIVPAVVLALLSLLVFGDVRMAVVSLTVGSAAMLLARALIVVGKRTITRFSSHPAPARRG